MAKITVTFDVANKTDAEVYNLYATRKGRLEESLETEEAYSKRIMAQEFQNAILEQELKNASKIAIQAVPKPVVTIDGKPVDVIPKAEVVAEEIITP